MIKKLYVVGALLLGLNLVGQETTKTSLKDVLVQSMDSLKADMFLANEKYLDSFVLKEYVEVTLMDSLWLKEMYNSPLHDNASFLLDKEELTNEDLPELSTELLKERLEAIDAETPFYIAYNPGLERIIKGYLKNRKKSLAVLMGRAEYYFPMFEEHLDKYDLPLEIKYLAIVESALRPRVKSRVGATGLWQFMYQTGKQFDLDVSSYVDERMDPIRATEAACKYLSVLYKIFGDWDLALAAYNSGPGNVNKAIRRSGGYKNYWNIRPYLPRETAGYVPAFYANLYIFKYAEEHGLKAEKAKVKLFETDTLHIKKQVTFEHLANFLDIEVEMLQFLNPQYKLDIIPYKKDKNYYVRLPLYNVGQFTSNEQELYAYVDAQEAERETPLPEYVEMGDRIRYRVVSGDYLGKIAERYGVSVSSIKKWNGLKSNNLRVGQRLTIYPRKVAVAQSSAPSKKQTTKTPKGSYDTYTVKKGESLWTISKKYDKVTVQNLKEWNNIWTANSLKPGMKIKIYKL